MTTRNISTFTALSRTARSQLILALQWMTTKEARGKVTRVRADKRAERVVNGVGSRTHIKYAEAALSRGRLPGKLTRKYRSSLSNQIKQDQRLDLTIGITGQRGEVPSSVNTFVRTPHRCVRARTLTQRPRTLRNCGVYAHRPFHACGHRGTTMILMFARRFAPPPSSPARPFSLRIHSSLGGS